MNGVKISNSIYISIATLESILILLFDHLTYYYYDGLLWLFPISLLVIPIYRAIPFIKEIWNKNPDDN